MFGISKTWAATGLFEILKMFYPPEGLCRAEPERGPIVFTYVFLCRKGFQFTGGFLTLKMFYLMGRDGTDGTDGTGRDGHQKCPLKFFILCGYID